MLKAARHFHYCVIDGRTVVLDLRSNRYMCLIGAVHEALRDEQHVAGSGDRAALAPLIERGWLVGEGGRALQPCPDRKAQRIAVGIAPRLDRWAPARIAWAIAATKLALATRSLDAILTAYGSERPVPLSDALIAADMRFRQARLYVPVRRNCLLDSLAELRFLGLYGLQAELVFGVSLDPFAAHCWLEAADAALGDEPETIAPFTPILRVA